MRARGIAAALATLVLAGCTQGAVMRGRLDGLTKIVDEAENNGAKKCAPRELALARSNIVFAQIDLDQGQLSNADKHVDIAEVNAHAALDHSPAGRCAERVSKPGDRDGDGYPDAVDQCPDEPETWNTYKDDDGCPDDLDTDGDGIGDTKDQCPLLPEDMDGYLDDDGCPDLDNDFDGVPDSVDKCPSKPEDIDGFEDEDGCPDPDNDNDTVLDPDDVCPNTPGAPGGSRPGCPGLVVVTAHEIRITEQIHFDTGKATIKKESFPILDAIKDVLVQNPKIRLEVQGHTDNVGSAASNMKLSQARAASCRSYLEQHGIEGSRLVAKGYGMTRPIVPNTTAANKALNRRVQFIRTEGTP